MKACILLNGKIEDLNFLKKTIDKENYDYIGTVIQKNQSNLDINLTAGPNPIVKTR
ncbi:MAG: hypothetical protein RSA71_06875 [Eubacterium sp.]